MDLTVITEQSAGDSLAHQYLTRPLFLFQPLGYSNRRQWCPFLRPAAKKGDENCGPTPSLPYPSPWSGWKLDAMIFIS